MSSNDKSQAPLTTSSRGEDKLALRKLTRRELARLSGGAEYSIIETRLSQGDCGSRSNAYGAYTWAGGKCYLERYM